MSISRKKSQADLSNQYSLFDNESREGLLDVRLAFRDALGRSITKRIARDKQETRYTIAAKISELTRHDVSKDMLDKCTASDLSYGLRAEDLAATCYVIGSLEPASILFAPIGCSVVDAQESKLVKLARLEQENARLHDEMVRLRLELGMKPTGGR